ncbi:ester cyclase [Paenibacillus sp. GCM10027626]|uniref:ester cyclase n=1 Tax=Paenibacillus sp. GCM10027626 TaxID=3273411 RepID=UPI0036367CEB
MDPIQHNNDLYEKWVKAWNSDIHIVDSIVSENCIFHRNSASGVNAGEITGAEPLKKLIQNGTKPFKEHQMEIVVGPITTPEYVSVRWRFTGKYNGKIPGAKAKKNKVIAFEGIDIFKIQDGLISEYWVNSEEMSTMQQLGML